MQNKAILVEFETRSDDVSQFSENEYERDRSREHEKLHSEKKVSKLNHLIYQNLILNHQMFTLTVIL